VTLREARAYVGRALELPVEAPQGPTCIYRSKDRARFVTVAVETFDLEAVKRRLRQRTAVTVFRHVGYCGHYGQDMLYVGLGGARILRVGASCAVARRFAARAVRRLAR